MRHTWFEELPVIPYFPCESGSRAKHLQVSAVRAWNARKAHRKMKQLQWQRSVPSNKTVAQANGPERLTLLNEPPDPRCMLKQNHREGRSFHFFLERTSIEWSGWLDRDFWSILVPQAAASCPAARHALMCLGAYHESLEAWQQGDRARCAACKDFSVQQGNKALACFRQDYDDLPLAMILCCYIILNEFTANLDHPIHLQTRKAQYEIMNEVRRLRDQSTRQMSNSDMYYISTYLEPLVDKQSSKGAQFINPLFCLRMTPSSDFYVEHNTTLPHTFDTLWHARQTLEFLLNSATYAHKTSVSKSLPAKFRAQFEQWLIRLQKFRDASNLSETDLCSWQLLKAASKICFMMIETVYLDNEMVFDQYVDDYRGFALAFSELLAFKNGLLKTKNTFSIDSGLLCLAGWMAQRWCRDPIVRRQLINLLFVADRSEGADDSRTWAAICQRILLEEETGISPLPLHCYDIPLAKRLRIREGAVYEALNLLRISMQHAPLHETQTNCLEDLWIHSTWSSDTRQGKIEAAKVTRPDVIFGEGFTSVLSLEGRYFTFIASRFTFPIPRV